MKEFITTEETGTLFIERILFEAYYPILFSCTNEKKETFICVCSQNCADSKKWLIGKTEPISIIKMLRNELTVRDLFQKHTSCKIFAEYKNKEMNYIFVDDWEDDNVYLPKKESLIDAEPGEFDDDIQFYEDKENLLYDPENYHKIIEGTYHSNRNPIGIIDEITLCLSGTRDISGFIMQTEQISNIIQQSPANDPEEISYNEDTDLLYEKQMLTVINSIRVELDAQTTNSITQAA
jgi:hypothetical protein